jgi:hypothetical protein
MQQYAAIYLLSIILYYQLKDNGEYIYIANERFF